MLRLSIFIFVIIMMRTIKRLVNLKMLLILGILTLQPSCTNQSNQMSRSYNYLLYIPEGLVPDEGFPLLMFLHGSGERGDDLALVKAHGPPSFLDDTTDFPFMVVSPQCPAEEMWDSKILSSILDEVIAKNAVDINRIYVTGLSIGGQATWDLAMFEPYRLAAIVPICGEGKHTEACKLKHLPIWVFHGALDEYVPHTDSDEMVDALKDCGGNVKYTLYPEVDHFAWVPAYKDPELYKWLLRQVKTDDR